MTQDLVSDPDNHFFKFLKSYDFQSLDKIAIAVSGGPDSIALAFAAIRHFQGQIYIITIDHQLREASKIEASNVAAWVDALDQESITHHILKWDHDNPDAAIMEQARSARYALMKDFCETHAIPLLLTGHHQDDQAETFLIRLIKGSGLDGLAGMNVIRNLSKKVILGRPFLEVSKESLIQYCNDHQIEYVSDPSNENAEYLRPRLRKFIHGMAEEGMDNALLSRTSSRLARVKETLKHYTKEAYDLCCVEAGEDQQTLDYQKWAEFPDEIALRIIQKAMNQHRNHGLYPVRMNKLEDLIMALKYKPEAYNDRTLGGSVIRLKDHVKDSATKIVIEKEA